MARHRFLVARLSCEPAQRGLDENRAADCEAFDAARCARIAERGRKILLRRLQPEHHDAAAQRIAGFDRRVDLGPGGGRLAFELPPIRLDPDCIKPR